MREILPCPRGSREGAFASGYASHCAYLWPEPYLEKPVPQGAPGRPVVPTRYDVHALRQESRCQQFLPADEAVLAAEAKMDRERSGAQRADEPPDAALLVRLTGFFGPPTLDPL